VPTELCRWSCADRPAAGKIDQLILVLFLLLYLQAAFGSRLGRWNSGGQTAFYKRLLRLFSA